MNLEQTKRVTAVLNEFLAEIRQSTSHIFNSEYFTEEDWNSIKTETMNIAHSYFRNAKEYDFNGLLNGLREFVMLRQLIVSTDNRLQKNTDCNSSVKTASPLTELFKSLKTKGE